MSAAPANSLSIPNRRRDGEADLRSLVRESGRIALSFDAGAERSALAAGTMIADILGEPVRLAGTGAEPLLKVHVGERPPAGRSDGAPCLVIRRAVRSADTAVRLEHRPWAACGTVQIPSLGWDGGATGTTVLASDRGPVLSRLDGSWVLHADLPGVYAREVLLHSEATGNVAAILAAHLVMRAALASVLDRAGRAPPARSLITVDAEDQQRYFINRHNRCSNIRGAATEDMRFSRSCRTIMQRCEQFGLKSIFMVTGDEIDPSFRDAFGDPLVGLDENRTVLAEMTARGHGVACHGFDHEWWLSKGRSAIAPMSLTQKLRYFHETSGDLRTLLGLTSFALSYGPLLWRARRSQKRRPPAAGEPFSYEEMQADIERWMQLVGHDEQRLFIRYPGYVRSTATLEFLDDRFEAAVDSSDLYALDDALPGFAYSVLAIRDGVLRRTCVVEVPCIWIDKLLRTPDQERVAAQIDALRTMAQVPGSVFSFVTHTKVLGSDLGHCHVYLHDPTKGMALPMVEASWKQFARFLAEHTESQNWRDLERGLFGSAA